MKEFDKKMRGRRKNVRNEKSLDEEKLYSGRLNDELILKTIRQAADDYEDGAIIECADTLQLVVNAIRDYDREYDPFKSKEE